MGGVVDMFKGLVGGTTKAEKEAKAEQAKQASLLAAQQAENDKLLKERQDRMSRARVGRSSLLSGTEAGVQQETPLQSTLG